MYVKVIDNGCPICEGYVKGSAKNLYYCKNCNLLFRESQLNPKKATTEVITDNPKILKRIDEKGFD